jgi:hypothetical protein
MPPHRLHGNERAHGMTGDKRAAEVEPVDEDRRRSSSHSRS